MIALMLVIMLLINPLMTLLLFLMTPVCIVAARSLEEGLRHFEEIALAKRQQLQADVSETLDNIRVIRSFNKEQYYQDHIARTIDEFSDASISLAIRRQLMNNIVQAILLLPWIGLISVGSWMVHQELLTLGDLMLFVTFEGLLRSPLGQLTYYLSKFNADLVAPERVREVNELTAEQSGHEQPRQCNGSLSFDHLSFTYGNNKSVIRDFSLNIPAGKRVALVGSSGAGKTTLMNLMLGFYDHQHDYLC
jgi:ATP-binding cassette subfamily B protein